MGEASPNGLGNICNRWGQNSGGISCKSAPGFAWVVIYHHCFTLRNETFYFPNSIVL